MGKQAAGASLGLVDAALLRQKYLSWLERQPLSRRTKDAYSAQVSSFLRWLTGSEHGSLALTEPNVRDWAVRDYKRFVKTESKWAPASVNQALAALDNFYRSLGVGRPEVNREELPHFGPRALEESEQRQFLRSVEADPSTRDRAIANLFFYTGLRLSEVAALDMADVSVWARRGHVRVRSGKGDAYREVPLNSSCRSSLDDWLLVRARRLSALALLDGVEGELNALWVARTGTRMTPRAIDMVIRRLAKAAGLSLSAHVLRHTCVTNLIRSGADVVLVAEIAGHRRLDTTRRYSLPSQADRDAALEAVLVEI